MTPTWLHVCFLNTQLLRMWDLDSNKGRKCCLSPLLPASCCLVSLFSTPHICFNLLSHHVLSSDSPAPLQTLSVLCLPPFKLHFFKRGLIAHKAKAGEDSTSEQNPWYILHHGNHRGQAERSGTISYSNFDPIWPHIDLPSSSLQRIFLSFIDTTSESMFFSLFSHDWMTSIKQRYWKSNKNIWI